MMRSKLFYSLIAALIIAVAGFYAIDTNSKEASVFSMPNFTTTTDVTPSDEQPAGTLADLNNALVEIAEEAMPAVVTVRITQTVTVQENPLSRFFGNPQGEQEERERQGLGSGVIVSQDGYILTNNHVVEDANEITVDLNSGESYDGEVIGRDPQTDIAVVKIDAQNLKALPIGNSDQVRVGEMVMAIGSPLGDYLANSVSKGIISAKDRAIGILQNAGGYETFLQTDAAINRGNSGGALINMNGELIGINSAIASPPSQFGERGGSIGIGFAVPSNLAQSVMKSLIENGEVSRGFLGITSGGEVDRTMARALGIDEAYGVIVGGVQQGGPADEAGLREGDVIQTLNGNRIESWIKFRSSIGTSSPGDEITLGINRDGDSRTLEVTLGELDQEQTASVQDTDDRMEDMEKSLGFRVDELTDDIASRLELEPGTQGVVVSNISRGSNAAQEGLQRGDVITKVNKKSVESVSEFREAINKLADQENPVVLLQVVTQGINRYVAFEL